MPKEQYTFEDDIKPYTPEKSKEEILYDERERFIEENYPKEKSQHDLSELLNKGLDGMEVIEKKDKSGEIEGLISYAINENQKEMPYISLGIMLIREELRGEGIMPELFSKVKEIAKNNNCEYMVAIADTKEGESFLLNNGFDEKEDEVNGRKHLRLDL